MYGAASAPPPLPRAWVPRRPLLPMLPMNKHLAALWQRCLRFPGVALASTWAA